MGNEALDTTAGQPASKVVDVALGSSGAPANDTAAKPATPGAPPEEGAAAVAEATFAPPPADPDKLERARATARARLEDNRRRMAQQADAQRREQDRLQARATAQFNHERAEGLQKQLDAIQRDPMAALAHLEKVGLSAKTLAEKAVEQSTPEARLRAELEAKLEERVGAVQRTYQEQIEKLNADRQERERQVAVQHAQQRFLATAGDEASFPAVARVVALGAEWKASILAEATRVLREAHQRTGYEYTDAEVLTYLDEKYSKLMPDQKNGQSTSNALKEATLGAGAQATNAAGGTRTLTNKDTQAKGTLPPDFDSLSDRDQKAALAALYRASRRP